ncbi:MAG TPA: STAS domain-containing protein [Actinomycetota bacterium]|nr:STAS domain-containing protein [Actinomycetota bacterium]
MGNASVTDEGETTPGFGQAVIHLGDKWKVRAWGGCDSERAWLLRDRLDHLAATGQRCITLDVSELRFADFTAVAILVGALNRIRQRGAEVAVSPPSGGAYQVLKRAELTTARAVRAVRLR